MCTPEKHTQCGYLMLKPQESMKSNTFLRGPGSMFVFCFEILIVTIFWTLLFLYGIKWMHWASINRRTLTTNHHQSQILFVIVLKLKVNQIYFMRYFPLPFHYLLCYSKWNLIAISLLFVQKHCITMYYQCMGRFLLYEIGIFSSLLENE